MRVLKYLIASVSFSFMAAAPVTFAADTKGYTVLSDAQPTDAGKKVEVIEFFGYSCPHCNAFDPDLAEWVKKNSDKIVFKRIPVGFRPEWVPHQKLYFALEAMGKTEEIHPKVFRAIHVERQPLNNDDAVINFAVKQGLDKQKFTDAYNSFAVQSKVKRSAQVAAAYKAAQVPLIIIDGRYVTSPSHAQEKVGNDKPESELQTVALKVMDDLVAKSKK